MEDFISESVNFYDGNWAFAYLSPMPEWRDNGYSTKFFLKHVYPVLSNIKVVHIDEWSVSCSSLGDGWFFSFDEKITKRLINGIKDPAIKADIIRRTS